MWAIAWDVFHHMPSQGGRGRRAAVDFVVCFRWGGIFFCFFFAFFFLRTHTACCNYEAASCLIYLSTSTDCESCTRPNSTNPGSMEGGECGLTRGTCCAVSSWSRSPGGCGFRGVFWVGRIFFFFVRFFLLRTHTACCKYEATLPHVPLY